MNMGQEHTKEAEEAILRKYEPELQASKEAFNKFYHLDKTVLGEGITGKVYKCIRRSDGMSFALKALHKNGKAVREVVLHKRMQGCPYIVQIEAVFENLVHQKPVLFVVMELMAGGELFNAISSRYPNKPFSEREVAQLVLSLCKAVKSLHEKGIAHRDLKPENLLFSSIDENATIKLTDFGFAKESIDSLKTPNFTPYYGAPEIVKRLRFSDGRRNRYSNGPKYMNYSLKCDTWSLGVIIYVLLCGFPPFFNSSGLQTLTPTMQENITNGKFNFPAEQGWKNISEPAKNLIRHLLVVNPDQRYSIFETLDDPWLGNFSEIPDSPLDSAGHQSIATHNWAAIFEGLSPPLDVWRTSQKIILQPLATNPIFLKRQKSKKSQGKELTPPVASSENALGTKI